MSETFDLIYADPPWHWAARSKKGEGRSAKNHYPVMTLQEIKDLPIPSIAAESSVLAIWVVDPMLEQAIEVVDAWGFELKTVGFYWVKTNKGSPIRFIGNRLWFDEPDYISEHLGASVFFKGLGYYTRANPEQMWICTRKKDKEAGIRGGGLPRMDKNVDRLIVAPIGRHSEKPDEARIRLERLFGDVRRVELFARSRREGWAAWGNQVESTIELGEK
jgi:N6-adenosine-specific RNA methylase IME4